jgi:flagellar export protein FliJ
MARTPFRLGTLLKLREVTRDDRQRDLADALRAEEKLDDSLKHLDDEFAQQRIRAQSSCQPGRLDVDRLLGMHRYELNLMVEQQHIAQQRNEVTAEVQRRRDLLVESDREVKVLEKLREKDLQRQRDQEQVRERQMLDEAAARCKSREELT